MEEPQAYVARIESLAMRAETSAGAGSMVWRSWGEGPPLLLLHGASGSWTHWIRNVLPLAARFRVLVPDMPGFGDSDAPPEPHTADGLAALVASGLDVMVPAPLALDLAGFSFGGIIGGLVAARLGPRVRSLVLLGSGGLGLPLGPLRPLIRIEADMDPAEIWGAHRENLRRLMLGRPDSADDLAVSLQVENLRRARFKSGTIPQSDVLRRALPAIRARIAGIWGERDAFSGPRIEECRRVLALAQGALDLRVIEGAGHWVPYEAAEQVTAALLDLLARGSRPRSFARLLCSSPSSPVLFENELASSAHVALSRIEAQSEPPNTNVYRGAAMDFAVTNELEIAYEVSGPADGQSVVCLHGWPDSAHCWKEVGTLLRRAGCRVYTPYLRGFSPTKFRDPGTMRSGQVEAFGHDAASFLEVLDLRDVILVGHDWGARAAYVVASVFPQRLLGLVALSTGYGTNSPSYRFGYDFAQAFWYQWFVATQRGKDAMHADRIEFCRYLWREWTPGRTLNEEAFAEASSAWLNDDWPAITIHAYLHRWGEAAGDPAYAHIEERMAQSPQIHVPTTVLHGDMDSGNPASSSADKARHFAGPYSRVILPGIGHLVPRDAPAETAQAILRLLAACKSRPTIG